MFEYQTDILISRPPRQVFEYVTACEKIPEWAPLIQVVRRTTEGEFGAGTRFVETVRHPLGHSEVAWEIADYTPNRSCTFASNSIFGPTTVTFSVEPEDVGTRLTAKGRAWGRGIFGPLEPLLKIIALRERNRLLTRIKRRLEAGPAA